jgi:hypothetical protein
MPRWRSLTLDNYFSLIAIAVSVFAIVLSSVTSNKVDEQNRRHLHYGALQLGRAFARLYLQKSGDPELPRITPTDAWLQGELAKLQPLFYAVKVHIPATAFGLSDLQYDPNAGLQADINDALVSQADDATLQSSFAAAIQLIVMTNSDVIRPADYDAVRAKISEELNDIDVGCTDATVQLPRFTDTATARKAADSLYSCLLAKSAHHAESPASTKGTSMDWFAHTDNLLNIAKTLAILAAGFWFLSTAQFKRRISMDIEIKALPPGDNARPIEISVLVANNGSRGLRTHEFTITVATAMNIDLPLTGKKTDISSKKGRVPLLEEKNSFYALAAFRESLLLDEASLIPEGWGDTYIRPGVTQRYSRLVAIPNDAKYIRVVGRFTYPYGDDYQSSERYFAVPESSPRISEGISPA